MEDLLWSNNGIKTGQVGAAGRIQVCKEVRAGLILSCLSSREEMEQFGREVQPIVREREAERMQGRRETEAAA